MVVLFAKKRCYFTVYKFGSIGSFTVCPFFFDKKTVDPRGIGCVCFEFRRLFLLIFFGLFLSQAQLLLFIAWLVPWGYIEEIFQDDFGILFGNQKKRWKKSPISTWAKLKLCFFGWGKLVSYRWKMRAGDWYSQAARFHQWGRKPFCNIPLLTYPRHVIYEHEAWHKGCMGKACMCWYVWPVKIG